MQPQPIPVDCPRCRKVLYPIKRNRPLPKDSPLARLEYLIAALVTLAIYFAAMLTVRFVWRVHLPAVVLSAFLITPAVIPGIIVALIFQRLPRVLSLRCASCGWHETFSVGRKKVLPVSLARDSNPTAPDVGLPREIPIPSSATADDAFPASGFDQIVDDQADSNELKALIYAEFLGGRTAEDITEDLVAQGWPSDEIEGLVEAGRKQTRNRRP